MKYITRETGLDDTSAIARVNSKNVGVKRRPFSVVIGVSVVSLVV